ncbi:MAG: JAB domain-containing protein [Myxococcota bacterium]
MVRQVVALARERMRVGIERLLSGSRKRRQSLALHVVSFLRERNALGQLAQLSAADLRHLGLGNVEARRVHAAATLSQVNAPAQPNASIERPLDAYHALCPYLLNKPRERFVVASLDCRNRPTSVVLVAQGAVDHCPVDLREIYFPAILKRASGIIVGHNHPSGDPTPSKSDQVLTQRLRRAGELLSIPLLDHIIVGHGNTFSSVALEDTPS